MGRHGSEGPGTACQDAVVARFLSPAWIDEAAAAAASSDALARASAGVRLTVQQVIAGAPEGEVRYVVAIDDGRVDLRPGDDASADVTFAVDWATAVAMATGVTGAQEAFTTGRLQVRGDIDVLLRHGEALAGLDAVFAELRGRTTY